MARTPLNVWGGAARYAAPATSTPTVEWTPAQKQDLTNAYTAIPGNTPTKEMVAGGFAPGAFNPYSDPGYILGVGGINQANADAQANHDYGALRGNQTFGYDANGNPISSGAGYDPFSQATELQRSYDNQKRGTVNSYASQGQLYAGSLLNKKADDAYNFNRSSDTLQRSASDYYHGLDSALQSTQTAGKQQNAALIQQALLNYLQTQGS